jgi:hypothetical protein
MGHTFNVVTSRKTTNAMESVTDRTISNRLVNRKVLCVMTLAPLWSVNVASREGADSQGGFYS